MTRPRCPACGKPLKKMRVNRYAARGGAAYSRPLTDLMRDAPLTPESLTSAGLPVGRGAWGDGLVCGSQCAWKLLVKLAVSVGRDDLLALLPPAWRKDLDPAVAAQLKERAREWSRARRAVRRMQGQKIPVTNDDWTS